MSIQRGIIALSLLTAFSSQAAFVTFIENGNGHEYTSQTSTKTPTKTGTSYGNWSNWVSEGAVFNCGTYLPDASIVYQGVSFDQTANCKQKQLRSRDVFEVYSNGTTIKIDVEDDIQNTDVTNLRGSLGTNSCVTKTILKSMIKNGDDVTKIDTSCMTDFSNLFMGNSTFNQNISGWDVSNGTNFREMFFHASSFNQDLSGWNVTKATEWTFFWLQSNLSRDNTPSKFN